VIGWLVFAPLLIWLAGFVVAPTLIVLVYSFCIRKGQAEVQFKFTWDNYHRIIDDPKLWTEPLISLLCWTIGGIVLGIVLARLAFQSALERHARFWIAILCWGALFAGAISLRLDDPQTLAQWKSEIFSRGFAFSIVVGLALGGLVGFILAKLWPVHGTMPQLTLALSFTGGFIFLLLSLHFEIFGIPRGRAVDFKLFWRAVEYALITTGICVVTGYPVAYFIGRASDRWRNRLLLLVMIPFWTSFLIRTLAWLTILAQEGPVNSLLLQLGWIDKPFSVLGTPGAVVLGLVYTYLPFMILPIYGSVEKLDYSMVEAAMDLGASPIRAFAKVILPMTRPGIVAGILLVFIPSLGMYAIADLMGGDNIQTRTIGRVIEDQFIGKAGNWPYGSALGMAIMILFAVSYGLTRKHHQ
jgi:spermidine/putrescine transport system permease protein